MTKTFNDIPAGTVLVGPVTKVIGGRFPIVAERHGLTEEQQAAWWQRTDFAWACGVCPPQVGVNYKTLRGARKSAEKHAAEHPGATVREVD